MPVPVLPQRVWADWKIQHYYKTQTNKNIPPKGLNSNLEMCHCWWLSERDEHVCSLCQCYFPLLNAKSCVLSGLVVGESCGLFFTLELQLCLSLLLLLLLLSLHLCLTGSADARSTHQPNHWGLQNSGNLWQTGNTEETKLHKERSGARRRWDMSRVSPCHYQQMWEGGEELKITLTFPCLLFVLLLSILFSIYFLFIWTSYFLR